jgi:hypothetical protein
MTLYHPWRGAPRPPLQLELLRTCTACGVPKTLDAYPLRSLKWRDKVCKQCRNAQREERRNRNREPKIRSDREYRRSGRAYAAEKRRKMQQRIAAGFTPPPRSWWSVTRTAVETGRGVTTIKERIKRGHYRAMRGTRGEYHIDPTSVREYAILRGEHGIS